MEFNLREFSALFVSNYIPACAGMTTELKTRRHVGLDPASMISVLNITLNGSRAYVTSTDGGNALGLQEQAMHGMTVE
jgi:hypothetical protein